MKALFLVFFASNLFACPNLAGKFTCQDGNETWDMTIVQTEENGVTTYNQASGDESNTYIADGVTRPHTVETDGVVINGNLTSTCSDPKVVTQFLADYQGSQIDFMETIEIIDGKLNIADVLKMDGEEVSNTSYVCTPTN